MLLLRVLLPKGQTAALDQGRLHATAVFPTPRIESDAVESAA